MTPLAYEVAGLTFRYPGSDAWVLSDVNVTVREGEFLGIIGPNGSGKTSLLNLLARLARPHAGAVRLFGDDVSHLEPSAVAKLIGVVPQESRPAFSFSVFETVLMGRFPHHAPHGWFARLAGIGWESQADRAVAWRAMGETNVAHLAHRSIEALSGGERQRVFIARALAQEPRVMLLDEPTAHLDLHHQMEISALLRRLNEERGLTIVLVSHDLNLASQCCDRLLLLHQGRIAAVGAPSEVLCADRLYAIYGCDVLVDAHPESGLPRITMPSRLASTRNRVGSRAQEMRQDGPVPGPPAG